MSASILTRISTLTAYLTGIATCTNVEDSDVAVVMGNKVIYCGECEDLLYEDTDGYGFCLKSDDLCRCSDKCHLTHGKP